MLITKGKSLYWITNKHCIMLLTDNYIMLKLLIHIIINLRTYLSSRWNSLDYRGAELPNELNCVSRNFNNGAFNSFPCEFEIKCKLSIFYGWKNKWNKKYTKLNNKGKYFIKNFKNSRQSFNLDIIIIISNVYTFTI